MADLHEALKLLSPVKWGEDVPRDDLDNYLKTHFQAGELIINSVPPPPSGTPYLESEPHIKEPDAARSHADLHPSLVRPTPPHESHVQLQSTWGKPLKVNEKDNPLRVTIYKTAGHDRHGSWFARRCVHEGLGFEKMKRAMMREFQTSLAVSGGPGAGAIRGLAADAELEKIDVPDVGTLQVFHLSAQFPGPTSARDFVALVMTGDEALSEKSQVEVDSGKHIIPRHYIVVSRPVIHPDAPERSGYVRAQYESVEMIREIPLSRRKKGGPGQNLSLSSPNLLQGASKAGGEKNEHGSKSRDRGHTVTLGSSLGSDKRAAHSETGSHSGRDQDDEEHSHDPELNPVEWIMVTRSDPGGGIPRFLIDRGTPDALISDIHKFYDWACGQQHIPAPGEDGEEKYLAEAKSAALRNNNASSNDTHENDRARPPASSAAPETLAASRSRSASNTGIMSSLTSALEAGVEAYAPTAVSEMLRNRLHPQAEVDVEDDSDVSSILSDSSSALSFASASEMRRTSVMGREMDSTEMINLDSSLAEKSNLTQHEKDFVKIQQRREKLINEHNKKREAEEARIRQAQEKSTAEAVKQKEKLEKELEKLEEKHRKEMEKISKRREKEAKKVEEERRKLAEQEQKQEEKKRKEEDKRLREEEKKRRKEEKKIEERQKRDQENLLRRERDEFRDLVSTLTRENVALGEKVVERDVRNRTLEAKLSQLGGSQALDEVEAEVNKELEVLRQTEEERVKKVSRRNTKDSRDSLASSLTSDGNGVSRKSDSS